MRLVTVFFPLITTGDVKLVTQDDAEAGLVVDSKTYPLALVGHAKTAFVPEMPMATCGVSDNVFGCK
jgi:hypothetical protein